MSSLFPLPTSPPPPRTPPQMANPAELFTPNNRWPMKNAATPASSSYGPAAPESSPLTSPPDDTLQTQMPNMQAASDVFLDDRFDISQEDFTRSLANIDADTQGIVAPPNARSSHPPTPAHPTSTHAPSFSLVHASYWTEMDSPSPCSHDAVALDLDSPVPASWQYSEGALFGDDDPDKPWLPEDEGWEQVDGGREATPPAQLLPRLHGTITPTAHADIAARKSAVRRCQQDTGPVAWPGSFLVGAMPSPTVPSLSPPLPSSPPSVPQAPASPPPHMAPPLSIPPVTTLEDMLDKGGMINLGPSPVPIASITSPLPPETPWRSPYPKRLGSAETDLPPPRHYPIPYTEDVPMPASPEDELGHLAFDPAASFDTAAARAAEAFAETLTIEPQVK
ncbi:hypothetical protein B0H17DRAFT_1192364 [Mycena rosella]|uniref:Uncharacterized protein n=1 Tax=Mycena rosella TaxID=1033263 RepID=A0AAD7M9D8_MYCRO|nr:hypothetical protein B0H17DRAFT_1192364 [Mycena rosella]